MKRLFTAHYDWLLAGAALVMLVASLAWFSQANADVRRIRALPVAVHLPNSVYAARTFPSVAAPPVAHWSKPVAQSSGAEWIYDLFTPPVVFYQKKSANFVVLPPFAPSPASSSREPELVVMKPQLYRLQLAGYFGEPGAYTVVFTNPSKPGSLRARVGERFVDLGISIRRFSVSRVALVLKGRASGFETVASVELWDERAGSIVQLDSRRPKFSDLAEGNVTSLGSDLNFPLSRPATGLVTHKK